MKLDADPRALHERYVTAPLACPEGMSRESVSFSYYTSGRPAHEGTEPHDTIFRKTHARDW